MSDENPNNNIDEPATQPSLSIRTLGFVVLGIAVVAALSGFVIAIFFLPGA